MSRSLLEEITTRLVASTTRAERLRTELAELEDDLERLQVAEQVVKEILAEQFAGAREQAGPADDPAPLYRVRLTAAQAEEQAVQGVELTPLPAAPPHPGASGGLLVPYRRPGADADELPADYRALLTAVRAADGALACKAICERLGLSLDPGQVEGVRAKLKRLAERGWLRKTPSGAFAPLP